MQILKELPEFFNKKASNSIDNQGLVILWNLCLGPLINLFNNAWSEDMKLIMPSFDGTDF